MGKKIDFNFPMLFYLPKINKQLETKTNNQNENKLLKINKQKQTIKTKTNYYNKNE